jgi:hypothetical protein
MILDCEDIVGVIDADGRAVCWRCAWDRDIEAVTEDRVLTCDKLDEFGKVAFCDYCGEQI